jgi:stalled ribosome alternative rescue factor ArfA
MFLFSVCADEALEVYDQLKGAGLVRDDLFAEGIEEKGRGKSCFDRRFETVFRWERQTPQDFGEARDVLFGAIPIAPVRIWLNEVEYCCNRQACRNERRGACCRRH